MCSGTLPAELRAGLEQGRQGHPLLLSWSGWQLEARGEAGLLLLPVKGLSGDANGNGAPSALPGEGQLEGKSEANDDSQKHRAERLK